MQLIKLILLILVPVCAFAQPYYKEGTGHADGELGLLPFAVRNDAHTPLATDGAKIPFTTDDFGNVFTKAYQGGTWSVGITTVAPTTAAIFQAAASKAFSTITGAYTLAASPTAGSKVVILDNQTDGDVWVSMDAGVTDTFHVKAGETLSLNLASSGIITNTAIHVKDGTIPSTSGTFYVYAYR